MVLGTHGDHAQPLPLHDISGLDLADGVETAAPHRAGHATWHDDVGRAAAQALAGVPAA